MMNDWIQNELNTFHSLRFLVVESSLGARILIRAHLLEFKHSVDMAWDDESAMELAFMRAYDFILVDKNLNCFELVHHIKKDSILNKQTPMIILTPVHRVDNEENKHQENVVYFKKPISKKDTIQLLDFLNNIKK